ncbi:hypothetical protein BDY21DRAFT_85731 [Lineolata rhizophorae]|uniref:RRM domain-containing protein n=1 Tax=Lineolata rhizophorae TaxID=578093 RepID=A0A6A6PBU1_9PEZI|nr:hypothetical protein BDY21DRAFT_85731 [Lineolata rhizophorae]
MEPEYESRGYDDDGRAGYDRDRSRSPRERRVDEDMRTRSASPNGRDRADNRGPPSEPRQEDEEAARNPGSNLFVTGIHPRLSEEDVARLFEKYGEVEKCNIMRDPHTRDSRGFGFVKMMTVDQADAAKEGLQGEVYEGRTLSIEKARRARPRTPTPGKYFGPPKRGDFRGGRGGRYGDRYEDRRGGYGRRDDYGYRSSRYGDRYDDRRYDDRYSDRVDRYEDRHDRRYDDRRDYGRRDRGDDYDSRASDRYARDDRYYSREDRRGGSGGGGDGGGSGGFYDREDRAAAPYGESRDTYGPAGRSFDRSDDRYSRR